MNAMEWLKSVQDNPQKSPVPPVPPEGGSQKTSGNIGIPPAPPGNSKLFRESESVLPGTKPEQREIYWGDEPEPGSSGGDRGNQEKTAVSEAVPQPDKSLPQPFLTADGTLSIPLDSDPKYHWWKGGQSVAQTRVEVLARMETERNRQDGGAKVGKG